MSSLFEELGDALRPSVTNLGEKKIIIGYHPAINGKESVPLQGIEPTLAEVKAIILHHLQLLRAVDECWADGQSGSWEIRQYPYSNQRITYYSQFITESELKDMFDEVYKGFDANIPNDTDDKGNNADSNIEREVSDWDEDDSCV